ncbi:MAG: hypothetical protein C5B49_09265 [Bdellovibrio sp.]|nr:MAG: hypothetical protein C5B49_09265 [Bdellovibrio sp.]
MGGMLTKATRKGAPWPKRLHSVFFATFRPDDMALHGKANFRSPGDIFLLPLNFEDCCLATVGQIEPMKPTKPTKPIEPTKSITLQQKSVSESDFISTVPQPKCYLCGTEGHILYSGLKDKLFGAPGSWTLRECNNRSCGLVWLDPQPLEEEMLKAYRVYYTRHSNRGGFAAHADDLHEPQHSSGETHRLSFVGRAFQYLKRGFLASAYGYTKNVNLWQELAGYLLYLNPLLTQRIHHGVRLLPCRMKGRLLDLGCGDGNFMLFMKSLGWQVEGTEVDPQAAELARKAGLTVHLGEIRKLGLADESYDAIVLNHVLEHVHDPLAQLKECHRLLKPGGQIRVLLPNLKSLGHQKFHRAWRGLEPPRHIHQFTPEALRLVSEKAGFECEVISLAAGAAFFHQSSTFLRQKKSSSTTPLGWLRRLSALFFALKESLLIMRQPLIGEELLMVGRRKRDFQVGKIGIAMAVYNPNPQHFLQQLESIQLQDFRNWICVIAFDSPKEELLSDPSIARVLADSRFMIHENKFRMGFKLNFEKAAREALKQRVDAIAFSDQDDVWYPHKLSRLARELELHGPGSLVHSDMNFFSEDGLRAEQTVWQLEERGVGQVHSREVLARNVVTGASSLFDAELAARFIDIPDEIDFHDHWFALVASLHGGVHPVFEPLHAYRVHAANVVGVVPFEGILRFPRHSPMRDWPDKLRAGWLKVHAIFQAATKSGLRFRWLDRVMHGSSGDFGLFLFVQGLVLFRRDRPLSRHSFMEGAGKFVSLFLPAREEPAE